jgi:hypothetical protein
VLCLSLIAGTIAGILALDPLLIHGFAPACSEGYAEANGTAHCKPEWGQASPYLVLFGIAVLAAAASGQRLLRNRGKTPRGHHQSA